MTIGTWWLASGRLRRWLSRRVQCLLLGRIVIVMLLSTALGCAAVIMMFLLLLVVGQWTSYTELLCLLPPILRLEIVARSIGL